MSEAKAVVQLNEVTKHYPRGSEVVKALDGIDLRIDGAGLVAIARALANDPPLILADEPTGNLDTESGQKVYELLKEVARQRTVLVVTHAEPLACLADRVLQIQDGRLVGAA